MLTIKTTICRIFVRCVPAHNGQQAHQDGNAPRENYAQIAHESFVLNDSFVYVRMIDGKVLLRREQSQCEYRVQQRSDHGRIASQTQIIVLSNVTGQLVQVRIVRFQRVYGQYVQRARIEKRDAR